MHAYLRRALCAVGLTGGAVLLGIGLADAASADGAPSGPVTTGESGILSGNQTGVGAQAPVNASGNQVTVIGQHNHSTSTSGSSTSSGSGSSGSPTTSGQNGGGSGNQTGVGVQAPVSASGNQVTVIGQDNTNHATGGSSTSGPSASGGSGSPTTSGQNGIGSGNQTGVDVQAPVNASGNQVTVVGQDNTNESAGGTSTTSSPSGSPTTTGQDAILSGNQTALGLQVPIDLSGNQVTVIGQGNDLNGVGSSTSGTTTGSSGSSASGAPTTSGESGIGSGNQTGVGVAAPVNASGNQVTVIGQDNTLGATGGSSTGGGTSTGTPTTSGQDGILSGNQTGVGVAAPVNASGNQVTVIGQDNTLTSTGTSTTGGSTTGSPVTSGESGIGSGNQTPVGVQVPVNSSGNQVTVIGQDNTDTSTSGSTGGVTTPGGTTPGGGVVSPPTGGVTSPPAGAVNPPTGGTATNVSQGVSAPGATVLPNTGLPRDLLWLALLGMMLVGLGSVLTRRRTALVRAG